MTLDYQKVMARHFADIVHSYTWRDTVLYALGLGLGSNPLDPAELRFVYEKNLQALPTMAVVLGHPGFWVSDPETGIDFRKVVHGEQSLVVHQALPVEGTVVARNTVEDIIDKGAAKGAILRVRRDLFDQASGALYSSQTMSMMCRGDGGFGGPAGTPQPNIELPSRAPDHSVSRWVLPQAALIYRLSADLNPLHADPDVARESGFDRPILHGLASFGIAGHAVIAACADGDAAVLKTLACRFSAPVFPGETLRTDIWTEPGAAWFRCTVVERDKIVLDRGMAEFR